jgi:hypothetical protein
MDFYVYYFFSALWLAIGLLVGYKWHAWDTKHAQAEPVTYTSGAVYDECQGDECQDDEPTTDHDAEVARRLLNW